MREKLKAAWSALLAKRTAAGWVFFLLFALFWVSDKWDSLNSLVGKMKNMGPFFKFIGDATQSPLVQLCVFILGVVWIGIAAVIAARTGKHVNAPNTAQVSILGERPDMAPRMHVDSVRDTVCTFHIELENGEFWGKQHSR